MDLNDVVAASNRRNPDSPRIDGTDISDLDFPFSVLDKMLPIEGELYVMFGCDDMLEDVSKNPPGYGSELVVTENVGDVYLLENGVVAWTADTRAGECGTIYFWRVK